jgi:hypothetical protein
MGDYDCEEIMSDHFQKKQKKLLQLSQIQHPLTERSTEFLGKRFDSPELQLIPTNCIPNPKVFSQEKSPSFSAEPPLEIDCQKEF